MRVGYAEGGNLTVTAVDETNMLELIGRVTAWQRFDVRAEGYRAVSCPRDVARAYLSRSPIECGCVYEFWVLPHFACCRYAMQRGGRGHGEVGSQRGRT